MSAKNEFAVLPCGPNIQRNEVNLHLNLSTSLPEHIIANATLMENTRILPELSFEYAAISQFNKSPAFESTGT